MTNAEARFNKSLRPRKPEGSLGRTAQDVHLDSHTAPELCIYTWSKAQPFIARRLDYGFVSDNLLQSCVSCDIVSLPNTDHRVVT